MYLKYSQNMLIFNANNTFIYITLFLFWPKSQTQFRALKFKQDIIQINILSFF